jgi:ferritin-like metal-binding protein YciE
MTHYQQEIRNRLKKHLEETYLQKSRLLKIITELGGKPTDAKASLPRSNLPTTIT